MILVAVFFFFAAFALFVAATLIVDLALPVPAGAVFKLASVLLLSALLLLLAAGLLLMAKAAISSCYRYFSSAERVRRRWLYMQGEQVRTGRLLYFRKQTLRYVHGQRIKRLEQADERRHLQSLARAVHTDLMVRKKHLPATLFKELQREHSRYRARRDGEALTRLQRKLADMA